MWERAGGITHGKAYRLATSEEEKAYLDEKKINAVIRCQSRNEVSILTMQKFGVRAPMLHCFDTPKDGTTIRGFIVVLL